MYLKKITLGFFVATAFSVIFMQGTLNLAQAQEEFILEEVTVTATKMGETDIQKTPIPLTVFSTESIEQDHIDNVSDLVQFTPSLHMTRSGDGKINPYMRGVGNEDVKVTGELNTAIYIDGVYIEKAYAAENDLFDVERIEVLRGPQGTLYGKNSTAGTINIITKDPSNELEFKGGITIGNFNETIFQGVVNIPIIQNKLNFRLSAADHERDGYMKNLTGPDVPSENTSSFRAKLKYEPTDSFDIMGSIDYVKSKFTTGGGKILSPVGRTYEDGIAQGYSPNLLIPPDFYTVAYDTHPLQDEKDYGYSLEANLRLANGITLQSITAYRSHDFISINDSDNTIVHFTEVVPWESEDVTTQEITASATWDNFEWIVGGYYYDMSGDYFIDIGVDGIGYQYFWIVENASESTAAFANVKYGFTDNLFLNAGIRYTKDTKGAISTDQMWFGGSYLTGADPNVFNAVNVESEWSSVTPKIGVDYQLTDDIFLYALFSKGYRGGVIASNNPPGFPLAVEPEQVLNYEAGFKSEWLDKRVRANMTFFYMDYKDMQVTSTYGEVLQALGNAGSADIKGSEMELFVYLTRNLRADLAVSYLDTEYGSLIVTDDFSNLVDVSGNQLPNAPEWKYTLRGQYVWPIGDAGFLSVNGNLSYQSDVYFDSLNGEMDKLDALSLINGAMRYETANGRWSYEIFGKNLADKKYYKSRNYNEANREYSGSPAEPRTYGFKIVFNY